MLLFKAESNVQSQVPVNSSNKEEAEAKGDPFGRV